MTPHPLLARGSISTPKTQKLRLCIDRDLVYPNSRIQLPDGGVAQLVEHLLCKQGVIGSNPFTSTIQKKPAQSRLFLFQALSFLLSLFASSMNNPEKLGSGSISKSSWRLKAFTAGAAPCTPVSNH